MYIVQVYEDNRDYYHAVAVIKRGSLTFEDGKPVRTLSDLRGKHACFAGVGTQVSCDWWTVSHVTPVLTCDSWCRLAGPSPCTTC